MKSQISAISFSVLLFLSVAGCKSESTSPKDELLSKPVVKKTSVNYTLAQFSAAFPDLTMHNNISGAYTNKYSEEVKAAMNDYVRKETAKLVENVNVMDSILEMTGCKTSGEYVLPVCAERARYEGREVWIFQTAAGLGKPVFSYPRCYVIDASSLEIIESLIPRCMD